MSSSKEKRIRVLKEIIITKKLASRQLLLEALNKRLGDTDKIKTSTLDNYLKEAKISFDVDKGYYDFNNEETREKTLSYLIQGYKKKYRLTVEEPILLGSSLINNEKSLYLLIVNCISNYEKQVYIKLKKFITPTSYQINTKSIFFYFFNKKEIEEAYILLNIK